MKMWTFDEVRPKLDGPWSQWCWPRTTPDQRMEYAEEVFADREYWPEIRAAVASER